MGVNDTPSRRIVWISAAVYVPLCAAGLGWAWLARGPRLFVAPDPWLGLAGWRAHGASVALGLGLALVTVLWTRRAVRTQRWMRELHLGFREILGGLGGGEILALALLSGCGEEALFRLGAQPTLGYVAASVVFGLAHIGPSRRYLPWTAWALAMGFALGAIFAATGSILGPVLAHVLINAQNLDFIVHHDPRGPVESSAPKLVARRERR